MKPMLFLIASFFPFVVLAEEKDLELDVNYRHFIAGCIVVAPESACQTALNPDADSPKLIHTATISLFAEPGHSCGATLEIINVQDSGGSSPELLTVFATGQSPGSASVTFAAPILIEDRDSLRVAASNIDGLMGGCRAEATAGVELR